MQDEPSRDDASEFLVSAMRFVNGFRMLVGSPLIPVIPEPKSSQRMNVDELAKLHPGFRKTRSIVLHRFGTEPEFAKWHPERSNAEAEFLPQPPDAVSNSPPGVDETTELHPVFRAVLGAVLRRFGVELESGNSNPPNSDNPVAFQTVVTGRSMRAGRPVAIRTFVTRQLIPAFESAAQEVVLRAEPTNDVSRTLPAAPQAVQQMIEFFAMLFDADVDEDTGLAPEALAIRSMPRLNVRPSLLTFPVDERDSWSTEKKAKATLVGSQRNPTALFGAGLIDGIPDSVIEDAARTKYRDFPAITGRVNRLRDGRIGKFGWKGQTASLRDFTLTACAVELGLNVPGHDQAAVPYKPEYRSPGLDLTDQECNALVSFLASLPAPTRAPAANADYAAYLEAGEKLFAETGCAACHTRKLGDVDGIYSDLLLHDMGPALADSGQYGTILPEDPDDPDEDDSEPAIAPLVVNAATNSQSTDVSGARPSKAQSRSPRRSEWRTPPLWGVRDSGPYLHDGGAETIQDAIALHGGEALPSTNRFFKLPHEKRQQLISFLKSLTAPQGVAVR